MTTKSLQQAQLNKRGIELVDPQKASIGYVWLRCKKCGQIWKPMIQTGGRLPRGFWKCPKECNLNS